MAKKPTPDAPEKLGRRQQFAQTYQMAKRSDPAIGRWVAGAGVLAAVVGFAVFWLVTGRGGVLSIVLSVVGALMLGVLAALIVFSRRAQKAVYGQMEGQVGAAAGALGLLKRGWTVDQAIAFTRQQDVVHRVVGPPGIVLVGEGNPGRSRPCWPPSVAATSASPPTPRSTSWWSAATRRRARCRCPSWPARCRR